MMNNFTKEDILKKYDRNSVAYIIAHKDMNSFKEYCTCGAYAKEFVNHEPWCPQEIEVMA